MAPKVFGTPKDDQRNTSDDVEARRILGVRAKATNRSAPFKSAPSNGSSVGGRKVNGGARVKGGRA